MSQTHTLAAYLVSNRWADIPDDVRHEARRSLVNYLGCAIGGSPHPAVDLAIKALSPFSGERTASVLGRSERLDPLHEVEEVDARSRGATHARRSVETTLHNGALVRVQKDHPLLDRSGGDPGDFVKHRRPSSLRPARSER